MELTFSSGFASLSLGRVLVKFLSRFPSEALSEYRLVFMDGAGQ